MRDMAFAGTPSPRRHYQWSSPQKSDISDLISPRNSEAQHKALIEYTRHEQNRVRAEAEHVYKEYIHREEQAKFEQEQRRRKEEHQRQRDEELKQEKIREEEQLRVQDVKEREERRRAAEEQKKKLAEEKQAAEKAAKVKQLELEAQKAAAQPIGVNATAPTASKSIFLSPSSTANTSASTAPFGAVKPSPLASGTASSTIASQANQRQEAPDRLSVIHKSLKDLRQALSNEAKTNAALKACMGDMRREIRKKMGQLTGGVGANKPHIVTINKLLKDALANSANSQMVDLSLFVTEPRSPRDGAIHNSEQLPALFIYLLNMLSKAAILQFLNEAAVRPETADPVGIVLATIFSDPEYHWRGQSLIDILMAKFRVACPVLFGYRGSESTEAGRRALGWRRDSNQWIPEQEHMDRMSGLGAGFAAMALRNFSRNSKTNPYPPTHYWTAMALIINTPPNQVSNTQCIVLRAMIHLSEQRFLTAYGTAAVAALRAALVDFPARVPLQGAAVSSLKVLGEMIYRDTGLPVGPDS